MVVPWVLVVVCSLLPRHASVEPRCAAPLLLAWLCARASRAVVDHQHLLERD